MKTGSRQSLRFARLYLENWRNFARVDVELPSRVFLAGANASGKSNFLDVSRFLHDIAAVGGGLQEAVSKRRGVASLHCLSAHRSSDVVIRVILGGGKSSSQWEYELAFGRDSRNRPMIRRERVVRGRKIILNRPSEADRKDPERLTQTYLEQVNVNQAFRHVAEFFASVRYLHIVPQLIRDPNRSLGLHGDPYGGDFLEQVARTPERTRAAWLRQIRDTLRVAIPQLQQLEMWRDARGVAHLRGKYEHWLPQGGWQTEEEFSDGTLRLLGLLWAALDGTGPLLLEEPELSLHSDVVRFLPQMLARMQRRSGRQILVSTHSPEILRDEGIGLDELLLLLPQRGGTAVRTAVSFDEIKTLLHGGSSLAEAAIPKTRPANVEQLSLFGK